MLSLKRQRLRSLQRFVLTVRGQDPPLWTVPGRNGLQDLYPTLGTVDALDFLHASPLVRSHLADRTAVAPWWLHTWRIWAQTRWPVTTDSMRAVDWPAGMASTPMWISSSAVFHVSVNDRRRGLLAIAEPQRAFRVRFARDFNIHRLSDITTTQDGWPTSSAFVERFSIALTWGPSSPIIKLRWLRRLYLDLTEIWLRLPRQAFTRDRSPILPPVGLTAGSRVVFFPRISNAGYRRVVAPQEPEKPHPATSHVPYYEAAGVRRLLHFGAYQRRWLLPVYHDVWLRLVFRLLPVRSRFWFLRRNDPLVIQCPMPGCESVETYTHLVLECRPAVEVWSQIWLDWSPQLHGDLSLASLVGNPRVRGAVSSSHASAVATLWHLTRVITIRVLWINRNKRVFESAPCRSTTSMVTEIYSLFAAHYRALLRHSPAEDHFEFHRVILTLLQTQSFSLFFTTRRHLLTIRRSNTRN